MFKFVKKSRQCMRSEYQERSKRTIPHRLQGWCVLFRVNVRTQYVQDCAMQIPKLYADLWRDWPLAINDLIKIWLMLYSNRSAKIRL